MDVERFERLLGLWATRRGALRIAGVAALAGQIMPGPDLAPAKGTGKGKGKVKKGCSASQKLCGKRCIPKKDCCKSSDCNRRRGEVCRGGTCDCPPGEHDHNGICGEPEKCEVVGQICAKDSDCCSLRCSVPSDDPSIVRCAPGKWACYTDYDCDLGWSCRGYFCRKG